MNRSLYIAVLLFVSSLSATAQPDWASPALRWRNIGPANMMGRIAAIDALHSDYRHVVVASASGGVFKSTNGGITWEAIFDKYGYCSIGAVTINQSNPDILWVGTGEAANRNSSGWGDGVYKSMDGGKTFQHVGLETTGHIKTIALHPSNPDIAYAASPGHLWGYSGERGLFRTYDGGKTWQKVGGGLPNDGKTGCSDILFQPGNPNVLFAAFYQRLRQPYTFTSGGPNGGIYKSTDGGKTWRKIKKGLATGPSGNIDLSICLNNPKILVAAYEADEKLPDGVPGSGVYRSDDAGESWTFLLKHALRPYYHGQIEIDPNNPDNIYVVGRDFRISHDGGKTFKERDWHTDGGDDHDLWIAPHDSRIMYLATDQGLRLTIDGGKTVLSFNNMAIGQYYAVSADMREPYWVTGGLQDNGLWTGPSNSREGRGILNEHNAWVGEGDGFHTQADPTDYRTLYLVNHVGFAMRLNAETREHRFITPTPETITNFSDWADPNFPDSAIRYTIDPGEHWFAYGNTERPKLPAQFRFNWSSPLILSPKNPHTVYFAGNHLFKSVDRGETWRIISPDLTTNNPAWRNPSQSGGLTRSVTGGENHCTIVTIAESPLDEAVLWAGTDDGNVQVSRNGGVHWNNVKSNMPAAPRYAWVSRVSPSAHAPGRCYVSLDNHRYDDFDPYVYRTDDYGQTWVRISANLPVGKSIYVVREDPVNPNLLFVGHEGGVHYSLDAGQSWSPLMGNLPTVAVYDLLIHPRTGDLIAGTHGRSIWILDDMSPLRQWSTAIAESPAHFFVPSLATKWRQISTGRKQPYFEFRGENPRRGAVLDFYVKNAAPKDSAVVSIRELAGQRSTSFKVPLRTGLNRAYWNFRLPPTGEEVQHYRNGLGETIRTLEQAVQAPVLREKLAGIRDKWERAQGISALNDIRGELMAGFAVYANSPGFFSEKLGPEEAKAGWYQVDIQIAGQTFTRVLQVREDP
ncbi:MAG: VPS10 domain-containing protein, partial [Saprospiraceae bacterium]